MTPAATRRELLRRGAAALAAVVLGAGAAWLLARGACRPSDACAACRRRAGCRLVAAGRFPRPEVPHGD